MTRPIALSVYLGLTTFAGPLYRRVLKRRVAAGKEDPARLAERLGRASRNRPTGRLIWFHAASVGESQALLSPIARLIDTYDDLTVLITTTTRTSATLLDSNLPERAFHQFSPIDTPQATRAFLDHWQPDLAIWTESEIWPRLMTEAKARHIPMHLINARVSPSTGQSWRRFSHSVAELLEYFSTIATQDEATANLMRDIGVSEKRITVTGSTKEQAAPLQFEAESHAALSQAIGDRPVWVAASTHRGEESVVIAAHGRLKDSGQHPLLILVPRHPERGDEVATLLDQSGLAWARRSAGQDIAPATDVYLADTLGELGLWYRLAPVSFIGGSLVPVGGHNPFEPIMLDSAVISGPQTFNFSTAYERLSAAEAVAEVADSTELAEAVTQLWKDDVRAKSLEQARKTLGNGSRATDQLMEVVARELR